MFCGISDWLYLKKKAYVLRVNMINGDRVEARRISMYVITVTVTPLDKWCRFVYVPVVVSRPRMAKAYK